MVEGNGSTAPQEGVLEEIARRLATITPEQFITPTLRRDPAAHFVCVASEQVKRLFTLRVILVEELKPILAERSQVARAALARILALGAKATVEGLKTEGSFERTAKETLLRLEAESERKEKLLTIVDEICWLEVRSQHPDLMKNDACVFSDWSLCYEDAKIDVIRAPGQAALESFGRSVRDYFRF